MIKALKVVKKSVDNMKEAFPTPSLELRKSFCLIKFLYKPNI